MNDEATPEAPLVEVARQMASAYELTAVVIVGANRERGDMYYATWGRDAEDRLWTADVGETVEALLGDERPLIEDFRATPAELSAALLREARELLLAIAEEGSLAYPLSDRVGRFLART